MERGRKLMDQALDILSQRRQGTKLELKRRQDEIAHTVPGIPPLQKQLAMTSIEVARLILAGPNNIQDKLAFLQDNNLHLQQRISEQLTQNGFPEDYLSPHPVCSICGDSGYVNGTMCGCLKQIVQKLSSERLNEVAPFALSSFDTFDLRYYPDAPDPELKIVPRVKMKEVYDYCVSYANAFSLSSPSLFMWGKTGLGKTHLSLSIARTVIGKGYNVIYGSIQDLLRTIEREHFSREKPEKETLQILLDADLLVLDDLGAEYDSSFNTATVYNLLNTRINQQRPTIISCNLTTREIQAKYNDRIVSRLLATYESLLFVGNDIRQLQKFNNMK